MIESIYQPYLQGALHDGTYSHLHRTHRISQKGTDWLSRLVAILAQLGHRSWLYQEGKDRSVFVLETSAPFLDVDYDPDRLASCLERIAYVRGYFDAEGGIPQSARVRFYIQFSQKDRRELDKVKRILESIGIECGKTHNPSRDVDPLYWRFYVRTRSHRAFATRIGSWHPRKAALITDLLQAGGTMISQELLDILRCPMDPSHTRLSLEDNHLLCQRCRLKFPIKDGLPNMVVEEAELPPGCESLSQLPCQREKAPQGETQAPAPTPLPAGEGLASLDSARVFKRRT
jgi:uncharacterized protein YbaR (Trm112 family)